MKVQAASVPSAPLRLGFLGVGWIGRNRMEAVLASGHGEACAVCDPSPETAAAALALAPQAVPVGDFTSLLALRPDGVLIATPSALHAAQTIEALNAGAAVFCQKPLGRTADEVASVLRAARRADRLLGVDMSYRRTRAMQVIREKVLEGAIGTIYAADLVFHNAYGPDKDWFYDAQLSGGGCVMDLGVHLVDLLLWTLDFPPVEHVSADLFVNGQRMRDEHSVEDYALATIRLRGGLVARLACSWRLHAGCDAVIRATFHGTEGSLAFANVDGSFYDFTAELLKGTGSQTLAKPPDAWGGRAAVEWAGHLACDHSYDPQVERLLDVAQVIDRIYGR